MEVAGANRRWRGQFRCRGSRRESAVAQLFSLGHIRAMRVTPTNRQEWLRAILFPFKLYTALAYIAAHILPSYHGVQAVSGGYLLCFMVLSVGGIVQKRVEPSKAYQITYAFAVADLILIFLMLPELAVA
jgi:hypothetical protein